MTLEGPMCRERIGILLMFSIVLGPKLLYGDLVHIDPSFKS
jgi:hypothetical protein